MHVQTGNSSITVARRPSAGAILLCAITIFTGVVNHSSAQTSPHQTPPNGDPELKPIGNEVAKADLAASQAVECDAGHDVRKKFIFFRPKVHAKAPESGYKLLLILPGGDGGAAFQPFVSNIYENAVPDGFVAAQLIAPTWSEQQAKQVVWPTKGNRTAEAKFTTESFIDAVIDDVRTRCTVDMDSIFTLGWSSSGPAVYAAALDESSCIAGAFVAMSVFKPELLPDLANAKGKSFFILHSPQDFIPMRFAEAAKKQLAEHGGATQLISYEGGHGWHGDVFATIRAGIDWMIEQQSIRQPDASAATPSEINAKAEDAPSQPASPPDNH